MPPRCGDINIEPLMPPDMSDVFIADYVACTIEEYSSYVLEKGECGKVGESKQEASPPYQESARGHRWMDCPFPPRPIRRRCRR